MISPSRMDMEDLKQVLNHQIDLHNTIQTCLDRKKSVIIQGDLNALMWLDTELEKLTEQARLLEQERLALMVKMGRETDTLRTFIASLEQGEDSDFLEHARTQLMKTTGEIKKLSETNRSLLTQSIRFIEQSVEVIASILSPEGSSYNAQIRSGPEISLPNASTISREA